MSHRLEPYAKTFYDLGWLMARNATLYGYDEGDRALQAAEVNVTRKLVEIVQSIAERLMLGGTLRECAKLHLMLGAMASRRNAVLSALDILQERFYVDISSCEFLFIPPGRAPLYSYPLERWGEVPNRFPSTTADIEQASQCLALGRSTAAVFHLMRVLEKGLHALGRRLRIPMTPTISYEQWQTICGQIESTIRHKYSLTTKGPRKAADQEFYSGAVALFQHFNAGWRIHVAHSRRSYNKAEAAALYEHVTVFMQHISTRLHERRN